MTTVINPPLLTKNKSYEQWKVETLAWTEITDVSREKQAITVALLLPENHEGGIAEKVFGELELKELKKENGISTLLVFLDIHLKKDEMTDTLEKFEEFDNFERKEGQSIYEYVSMFDFKYRKIEKKQMNLPPEILAFKLLRKANLTREEYSIILTGMNFENRATLYDDAKKALKKFKGSCRGINGCSLGTGQASGFRTENEVLCAVGNIRVEERSKYAYAGKGGSWNRRHTGDTHNGERKHLTKEYISMAIMSKVDKRINPPGSDGCLLKCYSCGSFRHLCDKCPDSWENLGKKSSSDDRSKPVKFRYEMQMNSEVGQTNSTAIEKLTHEVASLKKENEILQCEIKEVKAGNCKQLKREADDDEMTLSHKQELERDTEASVQSEMVEINQRITKEQQKQTADRKTETASLQIEKLVAKIAGDVSLMKKLNETLTKMQKEIENILSAHQGGMLLSILKNLMTKTRTQDIEKSRDNHDRFKKKMKKLEASQEFEKGNQPERNTGRTYLVSKSGEIYRGTEVEFWRFNKGGDDERKMKPTTKTSVQSSKEKQIEDTGTNLQALTAKTLLLLSAIGRILDINESNQIGPYFDEK